MDPNLNQPNQTPETLLFQQLLALQNLFQPQSLNIEGQQEQQSQLSWQWNQFFAVDPPVFPTRNLLPPGDTNDAASNFQNLEALPVTQTVPVPTPPIHKNTLAFKRSIPGTEVVKGPQIRIDSACFAEHSTAYPQTPTKQKLPGRGRYPMLSDRQKFLVFVKVLFKLLEGQSEHSTLQRAKAIVAECTQRNRMGDSRYIPLQDAIRVRLRLVVGESNWTRAKSCCKVK
jgi:hypothetical protein